MITKIGDRIRQMRGNKTQAEFARVTTLSKNTLGRYERGEIVPGGEAIALLCKNMDVNPYWLLFGEGPMMRGECPETTGKAGADDIATRLVDQAAAEAGVSITETQRAAFATIMREELKVLAGQLLQAMKKEAPAGPASNAYEKSGEYPLSQAAEPTSGYGRKR